MARPKNKEEYRAKLASSFANLLEEKGLEWRREWHSHTLPQNGITKSHYRGVNAFSLALIAMQKGYSDPRWVTMRQIMDNNQAYHPGQHWHLQKGSTASYVEYWYPYDLKAKKALTWEQYQQEKSEGRLSSEFHFSPRYTAVFNAQEVEGMPELPAPETAKFSPDALIDKLCNGMQISLYYDGGDQAYYAPMQDSIHLPLPTNFESGYALNATALHELSHATGHPTRLNRLPATSFGTEKYAYEELVAEMCACFMGGELSSVATDAHIQNHKAYLQSWIQAIRSQPETLVSAIKDAQSAACYLDWKAGLISDLEYQKSVPAVVQRSEQSYELVR